MSIDRTQHGPPGHGIEAHGVSLPMFESRGHWRLKMLACVEFNRKQEHGGCSCICVPVPVMYVYAIAFGTWRAATGSNAARLAQLTWSPPLIRAPALPLRARVSVPGPCLLWLRPYPLASRKVGQERRMCTHANAPADRRCSFSFVETNSRYGDPVTLTDVCEFMVPDRSKTKEIFPDL